MKIVEFMLYLYLLLRPYYIFKSGSIQISDYFVVIAFIFYLLANSKNKLKINKSTKENKHMLLFVLMTFVINSIYYIYYIKFKFILSSLYLLFDLLCVLMFSSCISNNSFIVTINKIFKVNLIIQVLLYFMNFGKFYDNTRYMATFNDPNQFAYYILLSFGYIYITDNIMNNNKHQLLFFILSFYLIYLSASTGMMLALVVFILLKILNNIKNISSFIKSNRNKIIITLLFILPLLLCCTIIINNSSIMSKINIFENSSIMTRIANKLNRTSFNNDDKTMNIWQERGYDKLLLYPQYLLYGSGEGEYTRFNKSAHTNEIHATLPSILFYYGTIPFLLILIWFYKKLKSIPFDVRLLYIALLIESFTLLNQRQALFWCIFLLGKVNQNRLDNRVKNNENN